MSKVTIWGLVCLIISFTTASHGMDYIPKVFKTRSFAATIAAATVFTGIVYAIDYWQDAPNRALCDAVLNGDISTMKKLLYEEADFTRRAKDGKNLLHYAAMRGHHEIAWILAHQPELLEVEDMHGYSPLYYAIKNNDKQMFKLLRKAGANRFCARAMPDELEAAITALELP